MTCQEAARLISEERDHPLTFGQKMGLRMHLAFCALCRGYKKNLDMMSRIMNRAGEAVMWQVPLSPAGEELVLSAASKQRIQQELARIRPTN
jgi:hypothetical protein